ncbi:MAG: hypothetical protein WAW79_00415 [Steroidobacteraceae bacterium]
MWAETRHAIALIAAAMLAATAAAGEAHQTRDSGRGELLFFASAGTLLQDSDDPVYDTSDLNLAMDLLGSWSAGRFRVLAEVLLSTEEQELERLQIGLEIRPDTYLWLGRFHQPASVWNARYHHGAYLQPSITRPAIESWEDEAGVLPQHFIGLLAETRLPLGKSSGVALTAGLGAVASAQEQTLDPLKAFDFWDLEDRQSWSARAMLLRDFAEDDGIGLVASRSEINLADTDYVGPATHAELQVLGVFAAWQQGVWRLDSALYAMQADFAGMGGEQDDFSAGYLQLKRELGKEFSVLGRFEGSAGTAGSSYLGLFPDFVEQRSLLGLRWDFLPKQALSVEFSRNMGRDGKFSEFRLQWSAVLP